jgi:hypothetical protein
MGSKRVRAGSRGHAGTHDLVARPLWALSPGGRPTLAVGRKTPPDVRWFCQEGDTEWTEVKTQEATPCTAPTVPRSGGCKLS